MAIKSETIAPSEGVAPPAPDDEGYVWPEGSEVAAELAAPAANANGAAAVNAPLPSLEELVQRIPAEARETLDDLFRARFVSVKPVSKQSLK